MNEENTVTTLAELEELYGKPNPNSLAKEAAVLTPAYHRWLEQAAFFAFASIGPGGLDCSPRGDALGQAFAILNNRTLAIPDRRGNNRLDTLRNILADPRVALLFLIPGISETLRINGHATIKTDPDLIGRFEVGGKKPCSVIVVEIDAVFFQCARAVFRAGLWNAESRVDESAVPTAGQMTKSSMPEFDAETYDAELRGRQKETLY